jgi:hypothetical protein
MRKNFLYLHRNRRKMRASSRMFANGRYPATRQYDVLPDTVRRFFCTTSPVQLWYLEKLDALLFVGIVHIRQPRGNTHEPGNMLSTDVHRSAHSTGSQGDRRCGLWSVRISVGDMACVVRSALAFPNHEHAGADNPYRTAGGRSLLSYRVTEASSGYRS